LLKEKVFWHETVAMPGDEDLKPLPEKVDVAVIGGGYTGLSAARALAMQGVRTAVLEAETIGWGASSRNGGMVLSGLKLPIRTVIRRYGPEVARQFFQASLDSIDTVEQIVKVEKIECGFSRSGHLLTASKPRHFTALVNEAEFMSREFGHNLMVVPKSGLAAEINARVYYGAVVDQVSAGLNPAQYLTGLAQAAARAGASLHPRASVNRLERKTGSFLVHTERGQLKTERIFVATSGYTGHATPRLQRRIIPIGSYIIATERLPDRLSQSLIPNGRMVFDSMHYLNYYRMYDGRLLFGGRAAFFPETQGTIRKSARILRAEMVRIFPQLREVKVDYVWGGTLDFTFDLMPHLGEMDGITYCLGYAGHGVAMATYLGQAAASGMLNNNFKRNPFSIKPMPDLPLGLSGGSPWFLPFVGLYYKFLDLIE
jgi:glycine/D-amino acid oxidase-like deaminating enzyme